MQIAKIESNGIGSLPERVDSRNGATEFQRSGKRMNWDELYAKRTHRMRRSAIRELLKVTRRPEVISFAGGLPAAELFPIPQVKAAVDAVLQSLGGKSLQYGETEGVPELRDWVARHWNVVACRSRSRWSGFRPAIRATSSRRSRSCLTA